jgi:thiamine-monophosphate kinase
MGMLPPGAALRRDGAQVGDAVCVTGTLGDAALGLDRIGAGDVDSRAMRARLDRPQPRVAEGLVLRGHAHAAIDLSDGLAGDLGHILDASGVGALIQADALPSSAAFRRLTLSAQRLDLQARGGDDYELCVCLPPERVAALQAQCEAPLTVIGQITAEPGLRFVDAAGATIAVPPHGYRHFE